MDFKTANDDAYVDYSKWVIYFNDVVVFCDNNVLEQMIIDLRDELKSRKIEQLLENDESDLSEEVVSRNFIEGA